MSVVCELINEILRLRHALLFGTDDKEDFWSFLVVPENLLWRVEDHIRRIQVRAIKEVTKAGELSFFGPRITIAVEAFCNFVPVANREPVGTEGRGTRLLESLELKRLDEAVNELARYEPALTTDEGNADDEPKQPTKPKGKPGPGGRFTTKEQAIISALLRHHHYDSPKGDEFSSVGNTVAATYRRLCELSGVKSKDTIKSFFGKWFSKGGNAEYKRICKMGNAKKLSLEIARLVPGDAPEFNRLYIDKEA